MTTTFQMLPEHAFEAGIQRGHQLARIHGRIDAPEVLEAIVLWSGTVADLQQARDEELAARGSQPRTARQVFEDVYGEGAYPVDEISVAELDDQIELYAVGKWWRATWQDNPWGAGWHIGEHQVPMQDVEAARNDC